MIKMKCSRLLLLLIIGLPRYLHAEPFKIGMILPLTGPVAPCGVALKNAIELAQSENPSIPNDYIEFVYEDSIYTGKVAISAFNKLTQSDKVDLVYVWGTTPSVVVAPIAEKNKFPLIMLTGEEIAAAKKEYVVDFTGRISDYSRATLEYARRKGLKRIGVVSIENQYIETLMRGMEESKMPGESISRVASFAPDAAPDFNSTLKKIQIASQSKKFDSLAIFLGTGQISLFYQKMPHFKITVPTFGSDYFGDQEEMKKAGTISVGSFFATQNTSDIFFKKYTERFKNTTCVSFAANMHDFVMLAFELFKDNTKKLTAKEIISRFEISGSRNGATGEFYFFKEDPSKFENPGKRFKFPIVIREVQSDGSSKLIKN